MEDIEKLNDNELLSQLRSLSFARPITDNTTRAAYQKFLWACQPSSLSQTAQMASATSSQSNSLEGKASKAVLPTAKKAGKRIAKISRGKGNISSFSSTNYTTDRLDDSRQQATNNNPSSVGKDSKMSRTKTTVKPSGRKQILMRKHEIRTSGEESKSEHAKSDIGCMSEPSGSDTDSRDILDAEVSSTSPSPVRRQAAGETRGLKHEKVLKPKGRGASKISEQQVSNVSDLAIGKESGRQLLRQRKRERSTGAIDDSTKTITVVVSPIVHDSCSPQFILLVTLMVVIVILLSLSVYFIRELSGGASKVVGLRRRLL